MPNRRKPALGPLVQHLALCGAVLLSGVLASCGGGIGIVLDDVISIDNAQGYAADAQAMPVAATSTVDTATRSIESVVAGTAGRNPGSQAVTVACANGGSVRLSVSGGSLAQQNNGQLDAGETYDATFNNCGGVTGSTPGAVLDGSLSLTVTAYQANASDLTHTASALRMRTAQATDTLNGAVREQRSDVPLAGGGRRSTSRQTSSSLALQHVAGTRTSSYELRNLDWTVATSTAADGALASRNHQGTLTLAASTPRRPNATLQVATQGTLTAGSDGLSQQGSFSLTIGQPTGQDRISVVYNDSTVDIALDLGNNGSVERRWTLTRTAFNAAAG